MIKNTKILLISLIILFATGLPASATEAANSGEWEFIVDAYAWGPEIDAKTTAGPTLEFPLHKILDDLSLVFFGSIKAKKDKLRLFADFIYLDMEDSEKGSFNIPIGRHHQLKVGNKLNWEMTAWVIQPMVGYKVYETPKYNIELAAGARYLELEVDLELKTTSGPLAGRQGKTSETGYNWDGIVAIKGEMDLSDKWQATAYLDGGSGDSDYTWQGLAGLRYKFDSFTGLFGYRYLKWEFDDGPLEDLKVYGPYLGGRFNF